MPEAPTVVPAKPASTAGVTPSSSSGVIHVGAPTSMPPELAPKPEKGTAQRPTTRESVGERLRQFQSKSASKTEPKSEEPKPKAEAEVESEQPGADAESPDTESVDSDIEPGVESKAKAEKPVAAEKGKKTNPWKLVDDYKKRLTDAETKLAELNKGQPTEAQRKAQADEVKKREDRLNELEEEIRFVNFKKSKDYKVHQEKYDKAWSKAMGELKELSVTTNSETGESRPIQPEDIIELVNLPLPMAKKVAEEKFGDFANDVMIHRKEIKGLWETMAEAEAEARKNGAERERQLSEQSTQQQQETVKLVGDTWQEANETMARNEKYGQFFTPTEGDDEGNERLEKGFALVDKAFSENPFAPDLKPEDRKAIVKRHAAVRNRAAAFGRLVSKNAALQARIDELTQELSQFKESEPGTEGGQKGPDAEMPANPRSQVFGALRKYAH